MTKKRPPYVSMYRDRHGKVRWRFRKAGLDEAQTTLPFDSKEWWDWYFAAIQGERRVIGADRAGKGTFNALISDYYASSDFTTKRDATKASRRREIERFRGRHGEKRVSDLSTLHILKMIDLKAETPAAANNLLKILRGLMAFAKRRGWRSDNPTDEIQALKYRSDGFHTWSDPEIATFQRHWPVGTRQRLAFDLLLYTGQRSADVRQMTQGQIRAGIISVRQEKTFEPLDLPVHAALARSLEACRHNHMVLLATAFGRPFTAKGFGNWISDAARQAGLPQGCSAHGLRKAAARRLAEAGCTVHQIMSVTGHRSLKEVERYTRAVDQRASAVAAMGKIRETDSEQDNV